MATVTLTAAAGADFGAKCRLLARAIEKATAHVPNSTPTGASSVLTITDGANFATVQVTSGPYAYVSGGGRAQDSVAAPVVTV